MAIVNSLRAYYKLEDANDALGVYNLTNDGGVTFATAGKINNGATTFSTTKRLSIANAMGFTTSCTQTISFWFKATSRTGYFFDNVTTSPSNQRRLLYCGTDRVTLFLNLTDSAITTGASSVNTATWYHVVLTQNALNFELFLNAVSKGTATMGGTASTSSNYAAIGNAADVTGPWAAPFDGVIDEFGIWDRVLTGVEITALYNSGSGLAHPFNTAYTMDTSVASFNVTGKNATLIKSTITNTSRPTSTMTNTSKPCARLYLYKSIVSLVVRVTTRARIVVISFKLPSILIYSAILTS